MKPELSVSLPVFLHLINIKCVNICLQIAYTEEFEQQRGKGSFPAMITPGYYLAKKAQENASDVSINLTATKQPSMRLNCILSRTLNKLERQFFSVVAVLKKGECVSTVQPCELAVNTVITAQSVRTSPSSIMWPCHHCAEYMREYNEKASPCCHSSNSPP